jgi:hypothetical protein
MQNDKSVKFILTITNAGTWMFENRNKEIHAMGMTFLGSI